MMTKINHIIDWKSKSKQAESTKTVTEVLNLFRATDIPQVVKSLSHEQQDILMKYLYAGMGKPEQFTSSVLLTWHEKVTRVFK